MGPKVPTAVEPLEGEAGEGAPTVTQGSPENMTTSVCWFPFLGHYRVLEREERAKMEILGFIS